MYRVDYFEARKKENERLQRIAEYQCIATNGVWKNHLWRKNRIHRCRVCARCGKVMY